EETMDLVQRTKYYLEYMDDEEALAKLEDVVYWRDLELEAATGASKGNWRKWNADGGRIDDQLIEEGLKIWNSGDALGVIYTPNFTLNSEMEYELEVELIGDDMTENMVIGVTSTKGTYLQFIKTIGLKDSEVKKLTFRFITTDDIEPQSQRIIFHHLGGIEGTFTVKNVMISKVN
ncbi:MAG: hypothetical protein GX962_09550, partial [Epulopiscium sp.]|nr:hypothetical protein [Candidatus Epulonipiscium sp.]